MSANPFRRSTVTRLPDETSHPGYASDSSTPSSSSRKSTIKTARSTSLAESPSTDVQIDEDDLLQQMSAGRAGSPPLPRRRNECDESDSSTKGGSDAAGEMLINMKRKSGSLSSMSTKDSAVRAPYNPFARTLATSEKAFGLDGAMSNQQQRASAERNSASVAKPILDVDSFKNLLMTGRVTPMTAGTPPQRIQDSSSSTDTSSISRQSIFEPVHDILPESPRTSFDHDGSDDDHDEHSSLMGASKPDRSAPALKTRFSSKRAGPQTVSFADFDETIPSPTFNESTPNTPIAPEGRPISLSDLNKPLPPPPPVALGPPEEGPAVPEKEISPVIATAPMVSTILPPRPVAEPQQKRSAPPPPATRRQGQSASTSGASRARSDSSLTQSFLSEEDEISPGPESPGGLPKLAPPPPPTRRAYATTQSAPSRSVEVPPVTALQDIHAPAQSAPIVPPPPPRRNSSKAGSINSTPSNASRSSSQLNTASAPPVPPPRRGGSSSNSIDAAGSRRTSGDQRRTSEQSFDIERGSPFSPMQHSTELMAATRNLGSANQLPPHDVLADLSALQQEVDALRAQAGRNG